MTGMWACPECGRSFASRNQAHACAALGELDQHFTRADPQVRATFGADDRHRCRHGCRRRYGLGTTALTLLSAVVADGHGFGIWLHRPSG
jgi:hypothetical protein